ncbi:MAG: signal peptidase II [Phycisphaerales bacterium]|nr:signal peptidase II [Phycisphaerales bacterium]
MSSDSTLASRTFVPACRSKSAWLTLLVVFAIGLALDLTTKSWAFRCVTEEPVELSYDDIAGNQSYRLPFHTGVKALPWDLLDFRLVLNHGAVFGLGQQRRMVFIAFTIIAVTAAMWIFGWWTGAKNRVAHIGIGLVLAGGIGNLYDRLAYGAVRDFLFMMPRWHLPFEFHWPGGSTELFPWIFNGADMMLLLGMAILLINAQRQEATLKAGKDSEAPPASIQ